MYDDEMPFKKTLSVIGGLLLIALIAYVGILSYNAVKESRYIGRPDEQRDTITVTGEGEVTAVPDIGRITVSVVTEGDDVNTIQEENINSVNSLLEDLKDEGIAEEDLQTTGYNLRPIYTYDEGDRMLDGYEVRQSVEVKIRNLDESGEIIQLASQNGVNEVSGLTFTIDDPEEYRKEAREKALENAQEKAQDLADIAGVTLGKIVSFSESADGARPPVPFERATQLESGANDAVAAPQFEAGSQDVTVTANIEYEIY